MEVTQGDVHRFSSGIEHIFFEFNSLLGGWYIIHMYSHNKREGVRLWYKFLEQHSGSVYFGTEDPSYIGNHCKFHANYGGKKVYQYVR